MKATEGRCPSFPYPPAPWAPIPGVSPPSFRLRQPSFRRRPEPIPRPLDTGLRRYAGRPPLRTGLGSRRSGGPPRRSGGGRNPIPRPLDTGLRRYAGRPPLRSGGGSRRSGGGRNPSPPPGPVDTGLRRYAGRPPFTYRLRQPSFRRPPSSFRRRPEPIPRPWIPACAGMPDGPPRRSGLARIHRRRALG